MAQAILFGRSGSGGGLKNITSLFNSYGDTIDVSNRVFDDSKFGYFGGDYGGTRDYYGSATSSAPHYVEFITGSYHSGANDGQVDSYYKVFYKTEESSPWVEANFVNGVWEVKQKIQGVRVFYHVQSTSSMHRPFLSTHKIIGRE